MNWQDVVQYLSPFVMLGVGYITARVSRQASVEAAERARAAAENASEASAYTRAEGILARRLGDMDRAMTRQDQEHAAAMAATEARLKILETVKEKDHRRIRELSAKLDEQELETRRVKSRNEQQREYILELLDVLRRHRIPYPDPPAWL